MRQVDADDGWLQRAGALTIQPERDCATDQLDPGRVRVAALTALARATTCVQGHVGGPCTFGGRSDARAHCALAVAIDHASHLGWLPAPADDRIAERFLAALSDAVSAVYYCRRIEHARDVCWFDAAGPGGGLCARVLAAAHSSPVGGGTGRPER